MAEGEDRVAVAVAVETAKEVVAEVVNVARAEGEVKSTEVEALERVAAAATVGREEAMVDVAEAAVAAKAAALVLARVECTAKGGRAATEVQMEERVGKVAQAEGLDLGGSSPKEGEQRQKEVPWKDRWRSRQRFERVERGPLASRRPGGLAAGSQA